MENNLLLLLTTSPNVETSEELCRSILRERLAACVNILPGIRSCYHWQGKIEESHEQLLLIKTRESLFSALAELIKAKHPYETPEIVAVRAEAVASSYLSWVLAETASEKRAQHLSPDNTSLKP